MSDAMTGYYHCTTPYYCRDCSETWDVEGTVDLNEWEPNKTSDLNCPKCQGNNTLSQYE